MSMFDDDKGNEPIANVKDTKPPKAKASKPKPKRGQQPPPEVKLPGDREEEVPHPSTQEKPRGYVWEGHVEEPAAPTGPAAAALAVMNGGALQPSTISSAEVDMQVRTAKTYPRHLKQVLDQACSLATVDEISAEGCIYSYSRGGKDIVGPSVRMAEIMATSWGNLRCETQICEAGPRQIEAIGTVWDMQANVLMRSSVKRSIMTKGGSRFNDDMITVTGNAAASIALRNAIFRVIPRSVVRIAYSAAREVAVGNLQSIAERRERVFGVFATMNISKDRVLARLGITDEREIMIEHLEVLTGLRTKLREGNVMVESEFPEVKSDTKDQD